MDPDIEALCEEHGLEPRRETVELDRRPFEVARHHAEAKTGRDVLVIARTTDGALLIEGDRRAQLPGGTVEPGESPEWATRRRLETVGLDPRRLEPIDVVETVHRHGGESFTTLTIVFGAVVDGDPTGSARLVDAAPDPLAREPALSDYLERTSALLDATD